MSERQEDLIGAEAAGTLDGLFLERVHRTPELIAYRNYIRQTGQWEDFRWRDMSERVARWQAALAAEHLAAGERAAIRLRNSIDWVCFDQAVLGAGLVSVPLYVEDRPANIAYILKDAGVKLLLVQNLAQWRKLAPSLQDNSALKRILILDSPGADEQEQQHDIERDDKRLRFVADWLPDTATPLHRRHGDPHALASIVYTSGTTGRSKGVMLSHYNMLSVAHAALASVDCYQQEVFLSFLPLSHTLERTGGYYLPMMAGAVVAHARSVPQLAEDLISIRPDILIAVPRIFERVRERLNDQLKRRPAARRLFDLAVRIGWRHFQYRQGAASWTPDLLLWPLLKKAVGDKVTARLGGRLRYAISGGAALPLPVARTFIGLGLEILQGYGLTETSPVISVNRPAHNDPASVGEPCRGIEVRIADHDELVVKSPGIMIGYWNNHAATAEMIDSEGWLHTGDQARLSEGRIYITGRLKDVLVLSNGEKVPPAEMESAICLDPLFEQALVVGEGRAYLGAVIVLNPDRWFGFARELGLDPMDRASLQDERLRRRVVQHVQQQLKEFPGYAKIRRVSVQLEPWTVEEGLMTPTLKLRRASVMRLLSDQVEALYQS